MGRGLSELQRFILAEAAPLCTGSYSRTVRVKLPVAPGRYVVAMIR
jgi:hypothetical protein